MKNFALVIIFVFTFLTFANAQSDKQISVHIPFDFYVQNQKMKAGDYLLENISSQSNNRPWILRKKKNSVKVILTIIPTELTRERKSFPLNIIFNRYGNEYILAQIRNPLENLGFDVNAAKTEKYLARQSGKPSKEIVAVNSHQK